MGSAAFAAQLCTPSAAATFCKLLQYRRFRIVHPMARLLSRLVQLPVAKRCFADQAILLAMIEKAMTQSLVLSVREELAAAVKCAVDVTIAQVSEETVKALSQALSGALKQLGREDEGISPMLRSIQGTLDMLQFAF